jgi:myosin heavy subunit
MLEEECMLPQGGDKRLLQKLHDMHDKDASYVKPRLASDSKFSIRHYAGDVTYGIHIWVAITQTTLFSYNHSYFFFFFFFFDLAHI